MSLINSNTIPPKYLKRVVITGIGIVSSIGNNVEEVTNSLIAGKSGIKFSPEFAEKGFNCQISAPIEGLDRKTLLDRAQQRFLGEGNTIFYGYIAALQAIKDSGLDVGNNPRIGCIVGSGGPSTKDQDRAANITKETSSTKKIGPFAVVPTMSSGLAAKLATDFKIKGPGFMITSACATSSHCIGEAARKIAIGETDAMIAGGSEDCYWSKANGFDAMGALATGYNDTPEKANRPFDKDRTGFVDGAAGAMLILEKLEHAEAREACIYAEIVGYGATSDGDNMVQPSGEGAARCMKMALEGLSKEDVRYINAHGTSTPAGDAKEIEAIAKVFKNVPVEKRPLVNSTKGLTGHALGGAGAAEAIYSIIQMNNDFVAANTNLENVDPVIIELGWEDQLPTQHIDNVNIRLVLSNSFGFGGTNATIIIKAC